MKGINFKEASFSLKGHIVIFEAFVALPNYIFFLFLIHSEGTLTLPWAVWMAFVSGIAGIVLAVLGWFTITKPLIKRRYGP